MVLSNAQWFANPGEVYTIDQSCRFDDDAPSILSRTPGSAGNRKTWTISVWAKIADPTGGAILSADNGTGTPLGATTIYGLGSTFAIGDYDNSAGWNFIVESTAKYRDPAAWYHIVVVLDTTQSTEANRVKLYVNGETVSLSGTYPDEDSSWSINNTVAHNIGKWINRSSYAEMDGYFAEFHFIDGTALTPSSFGETNSTTGQWIPKEVSDLTYGTNGFLMAFQDSSALGDDTSGEGNDYATSGLAAADQVTDSPTSNYCTWNPLDRETATFAEGNLQVTTGGSGSTNGCARATFGMTSGKWYWEGKLTVRSADGTGVFGVVASTIAMEGDLAFVANDIAAGYGTYSGRLFESDSGTAWGTTPAADDIMQVAFDADSGKIWFGLNNTWQGSGDPAAGSNEAVTLGTTTIWMPVATDNTRTMTWLCDFGQSGFTYTPPTDFEALTTANLSDPTTADPSAYSQTTIYTGTGSSLAVDQGENSTFEPDFVWIKNRDADDSHILTDSVRGATKVINSNDSNAETTDADTLTSFDSDGFTVGADVKVNTSSEKYVAWQWIEGTTPGFDVVSFTGNATNRTISHSLSAVPEFMMIKNLADTDNWAVYHASNTAAPATDYLILNDAAATVDDATIWNDTAPTSSVFSVGTSSLTNGNTEAMIAYLWAGVEGFSKFGSYTGNGTLDAGPFVNLGFEPAWLMIKGSDSADRWFMTDSVRNTYNIRTAYLVADDNMAEQTGLRYEYFSNGFRPLDTSGVYNTDGGDYVFAAFAKTPFKTALAG